jgi:DNA-binding CsgD family transcriptional regulator
LPKKTPDLLNVIQAAYGLNASDDAWIESVTTATVEAFGYAQGGGGALYDATAPDWVTLDRVYFKDVPAGFVNAVTNVPIENPQGQQSLVRLYRSGSFVTVRDTLAPLVSDISERFERYGMQELVGLFAVDPTFRGCVLVIHTPRREYSPRTRYLWRQVAAHVSAGLRLRRTLQAMASVPSNPADAAEAVVSPDGKLEHATGVAATNEGRDLLQQALGRLERAQRTRASDQAQAIELWTGLFAGRWSLVEHRDTDGRRRFLAFRNDPLLARARALTERERQIVTYAAMGHSNKLIAYSLGLSVSTVGENLQRARKKLGGPETLDVLQALLPALPDDLLPKE